MYVCCLFCCSPELFSDSGRSSETYASKLGSIGSISSNFCVGLWGSIVATGSTRSYLDINHYSTTATQGSDRFVQLRGSSAVVSILYQNPIVEGSISETALSAAQSKSINLSTDLCGAAVGWSLHQEIKQVQSI